MTNTTFPSGNDFAVDDISNPDAAKAATVYFFENFEYESVDDFAQPGASPTNAFGTLGPEGNYTIE